VSESSHYQFIDRPAGSTTAPELVTPQMSGRISILQIAARLSIGRAAVYKLLEMRVIPGVHLGRLWIVTRAAFDAWERTCGSIETPDRRSA
jgi:excisionase family DNA binding protein